MGERSRYVYGPTIDIAKIITTPKVIEEVTHSTLQELADVSGYTPEEVLYGVVVHTGGGTGTPPAGLNRIEHGRQPTRPGLTLSGLPGVWPAQRGMTYGPRRAAAPSAGRTQPSETSKVVSIPQDITSDRFPSRNLPGVSASPSLLLAVVEVREHALRCSGSSLRVDSRTHSSNRGFHV